jgi:hypothetical protein
MVKVVSGEPTGGQLPDEPKAFGELSILDLMGDSTSSPTLSERVFSGGSDRTLIYRLEDERPDALKLGTDSPDVMVVGGDFTDVEELALR